MTASPAPLSSRRRWISLTAATVVLQFAYWPIVASVFTADAEMAGGLWLGLAVTPFVFLVLAFASGHPRAPGATGKAMFLFLAVALPVGLGNIVVGLAAGFSAGAIVALRRDEDLHTIRSRVIAAVGAGLYLVVLMLLQGVAPPLAGFAIISGAIIPLAVVGIADETSEGLAPREHDRASR